jgi:hypothetical protein
MSRAILLEDLMDGWEIFQPDGDVNIVVRSNDRAGVEIDCTATEQPVRDSCSLEQAVDAKELLKLTRPNSSMALILPPVASLPKQTSRGLGVGRGLD